MHNIDVKYDKMIEDLKKEMNFSSLMYMVTEKADMSSVNQIKKELQDQIWQNQEKGEDNKSGIHKLWAWVERLTDVVAWVEIIVKMNFPLAI